MKISILQYDIVWQNSKANIDKIENLVNEDVINSDLLVLPEMFHCGFSMNPSSVATTMDGKIISWMRSFSKKNKLAIVGSLVIEEQGSFYNRLIFIKPDGGIAYYDKRHLFRMGGENDYYQQGNNKLVVEYKGVRIRPLICYDLRFPVWCRNKNDYDLLIFVANWPAIRQKAWEALLVARAIENQCYVVGVNRVGNDPSISYSGGSMIVDYCGKVLNYAGKSEGAIICNNIDTNNLLAYKNKFPTYLDADDFKIY